MNQIPAKQIRVHGIAYRSMLEARWAIILDTLAVPFVYEPASYALPCGLYVPDFWLPEVQHFLEIKPGAPEATPLTKARQLCIRTGFPVFFLAGSPRKGVHPFQVWWSVCRADGSAVLFGHDPACVLAYVCGLHHGLELLLLKMAMQHADASLKHVQSNWRVEASSVGSILDRSSIIPWPKRFNEREASDES